VTHSTQQGLDAFVLSSGAPGAVLAWSRRGEPATTVAAGVSSPHSTDAMTTGASFLIASVTKVFTEVLALRFVERGQLGLDEPIGAVLPDWPDGERITVRQGLAHEWPGGPVDDDEGSGSGPFVAAQLGLPLANLSRNFTWEETLAWVRDRPLQCGPGTVGVATAT